MSQKELDRAVAEATGEDIGFIRGGFSLADPLDVLFIGAASTIRVRLGQYVAGGLASLIVRH